MGGEKTRRHIPSQTVLAFQAGAGINIVKMRSGDIFIDARVVFGREQGVTTSFFPIRLGFRLK
jgi:hypothetical protein